MWTTRMFQLSPDGDDGDFGIASQMKDPELQELFGSLGGDEEEPPAPEAAPADLTITDPQVVQGEPTQQPVLTPEGDEGAQTPPVAPLTPQEPVQGPPAGDDGQPPEPEIEPPAFQSIDEAKEWAKTQEKRRRDLQSWSEQRDNEYKAQLQQQAEMMTAMQQQMATVTQHVMQPAAQPKPQITGEDVIEAVKVKPEETAFLIANDYPEALPFALEKIAEHHGLGEAMRVQQSLYSAQLAQMEQVRQQEQMQQQAPQIMREGFIRTINEVRDGVGPEAFDAVSSRVSTLCQENLGELRDRKRHPNGVTPEALQTFVMKQYVVAERERISKAAAAPLPPTKLPASHAAPAGTAGPGTTPPATDGDALVDEMAAIQRSKTVDFS